MPVPLLADVVGAFDGGAESLRVAFLPRYDARRCPGSARRRGAAAALPCAVELAAVGLLQSLLTLQLVDGLTRDGPDGRGRASQRDHAAPTDRDRAYAVLARWVKRVVVLDFASAASATSAIAAINDAVDAYRDLGLTVVLRHLSRDAALFLRAASTRADVVFDERDDDPSYYVAATTPDGLGQPKQGQTVVVEPADEGKGAP
ncbi:secondary active sulfate transmembrane transporter [Aureococcus anophagefferens]|nr:secondary active sulfate transmembrane transporter [Aureococcus anophagefferens]